jgi:PIN domain nuclease of toxin-antitoxin system
VSFLLDTNALLWAVAAPHDLSRRAARIILDPDSEIAVSAINLWEIAIKSQQGKLNMIPSQEYFDFHFSRLGIRRVISVEPKHVYGLLQLPLAHKDPFDRLLAAQSRTENLTLVTSDRIFRKYPVKTVW